MIAAVAHLLSARRIFPLDLVFADHTPSIHFITTMFAFIYTGAWRPLAMSMQGYI
jgi:hypothetical protein